VNEELPGTWADRVLHEGDVVQVPYLSLDVTEDMAGRLRGWRFYGGEGDPWTIRRAEQVTKFELFEKGARVRVETSIESDPFAGDIGPTPVPRRFIYDRPFFVFLWRDGAEWPYFGAWIGDASALREFK
jgi:beta-galactosidase/beta-glucuronidase